MKGKSGFSLAAAALAYVLSSACAMAATQEVNGVVWTFSVNDGSAIVGGVGVPAVPASTVGDVAIPLSLGGVPVTGIGSRAFANCSRITTISMTSFSKVETIGNSAFDGCTSLMAISFPRSIKSFGTRAFAECRSLESITLPSYSGDIPSGMFDGCTNLCNVVLPSGVTGIGSRAFYGCSALEKVELSRKIVEIGSSAFEKCTSLVSVNFGDDLRTIGNYAFFGCSSLPAVALPPNVEHVGLYAFADCTVLSSFAVSEKLTFDADNVLLRCAEDLVVERYPVHTVIFDLQDGSDNTITRYLRIGETVGPLPKVTREGFVFDGWYSAPADVTGVKVTEKQIVVADPLTIYARWLSDEKVFVSVSVAAGQEALGSVSGGNKEIQIGSSVSLKAKAKAGAVFAGWYADGELLSMSASYSYGVMNAAAVEARFITPDEDHLDGIDVPLAAELELGEMVDGTVTADSVSAVKWTVNGLPPGLKFDAKTGVLSGKPTKKGIYNIVFTATNASGYSYTKIVTVNVGGAEAAEKDEIGEYFKPILMAYVRSVCAADPADGYDSFVEALELLDELVVGEDIGRVEIAIPGLAASGLPGGISATASSCGLELSGMALKPGVYSVKFTMPHPEKSGKKLTTVKTVIVQDAPSFYVEVVSEDGEMGSATGSGVYHPGAKAKFSAKAAKGFVFAGWYQDDSEMTCGTSGDWRTATESFIVQTWFGDAPITARFAASADDLEQGVVIEDGEETVTWRVSTSGEDFEDEEGARTVDFTLELASLSLPKVTVGSLPSGISCSIKDGSIRFAVSDVTKLKPGMKEVSVAAKNQSGAVSKVSVLVSVPNIYSEVFDGVLDMSEEGYLLPGGRLMDDIELWRLTGMSMCSDDKPWTIKVTGLPSGMKYNKSWGEVDGVAQKEGVYTVTFTATCGTEKAVATVTFRVVFPTLTVENTTPEGGTVTGGGRYRYGQKVTLKATPTKGYVFSRWYVDDGGGEERTVSQNPLHAGSAGTQDHTIYAEFIAKENDEICFAGEGDDEWTVEGSGCCGFYAAWKEDVISGSLPKITAKGLPAGMTMKVSESHIELYASDSKKLKPGVSDVILTAVNQSGKSATRQVRLIVPNLTCKAISADSDVYAYPLTVGMPIDGVFDGIGLSDGYADWTLKASGLPSGLSFKNGVFSGVPTKAGSFTVTLTATKKGKTAQTATITVNVEALPDWVVGTFYGHAVSEGDGWKTPLVLTATISSVGKFTCKLSEPGTGSVTLNATLTGWDEEGKVTFDVSFKNKGASGSGSGSISAEAIGDVDGGVLAFNLSGTNAAGDAYAMEASARQDLYALKSNVALPTFGKDGTREVDVEPAEGVKGVVTLKFGKKGAVTATWTNPSVGAKAQSTCATFLEIYSVEEGLVQARLYAAFKDKQMGPFGVLLNLEIPLPAAASNVEVEVQEITLAE